MKTPDHSPGHVSRAKDPEIVRESQKIIRLISRTFWVVAIILALWGIFSWASSKMEKAKTEKAAALERARTNPPSARVIIPVVRPRVPRTLEIPQEGLRIWLEESPAIYPKLGVIIIETPSGRIIYDQPGMDTFRPGSEPYEPAGFYTFRPDPPESIRRVEIYNRW